MLRRCVGNVFGLSRHVWDPLCECSDWFGLFWNWIGSCDCRSSIEVRQCLWIIRDRFGMISAREANMWRGGCANGDQMRTDK